MLHQNSYSLLILFFSEFKIITKTTKIITKIACVTFVFPLLQGSTSAYVYLVSDDRPHGHGTEGSILHTVYSPFSRL